MRNGQPRSFAPENVASTAATFARISRKYLIANAAEFQKLTGSPPLQKYVRHAPTLQVEVEGRPGEIERVWVLQYDPPVGCVALRSATSRRSLVGALW